MAARVAGPGAAGPGEPSFSAGEVAGPPPSSSCHSFPRVAASFSRLDSRSRVCSCSSSRATRLSWPPARLWRAAPGELRALQIACQGQEQRFTRLLFTHLLAPGFIQIPNIPHGAVTEGPWSGAARADACQAARGRAARLPSRTQGQHLFHSSGPQPFWHQELVSCKTILPQTRGAGMVWR